MGDRTLIAWADHTFNAWTGCQKVSTGCANCYAERLVSARLGLDVWGPGVQRKRTGPANWAKPVAWNRKAEKERRRHRVFCGSLMDWAEDRPELRPWRLELLELIERTPWLDWLLLTKRPQNLRLALGRPEAPPNVWLGVSVENAAAAWRVDMLRDWPAVVRFVSYEPALGPLNNVDLTGIDWVIYGGESGPGFRPDRVEWAVAMRDRCRDAGVAFFYKQPAARFTESDDRLLGEVIREYPVADPSRVSRVLNLGEEQPSLFGGDVDAECVECGKPAAVTLGGDKLCWRCWYERRVWECPVATGPDRECAGGGRTVATGPDRECAECGRPAVRNDAGRWLCYSCYAEARDDEFDRAFGYDE